jgi:predicted Zn-dependent peptidase
LRTQLWELAHRLLFQGQSYGRPVTGQLETVNRLTQDRLERFHRLWYVPNNMAVIVVGNVTEAQVLAAAKRAFGEMKRSPAEKTVSSQSFSPLPASPVVVRHTGALAQIGLAARASAVSSLQEVCAMDVLLALLAEGRGSRLQRALNQSNSPALFGGGEFLTSREPSPFLLWATCSPDKVSETKALIEREVRAVLDEEVKPAEIAAAKRRLEFNFWLSNETYSDQSDVLGFYEAIDSYRFATDYISHIRAVRPAEVTAAAKKYLGPGKAIWLELLPNQREAQ